MEFRHYREGGKLTHCGCEALPNGEDIEHIVIERIVFKEKCSIGGRMESGVWEAYFVKNKYTDLPMVLNSTNRKRLFKRTGEAFLEKLHYVPVRLTKEKCRDVQDGGETWGLRISNSKPKLGILDPQSEAFAKAKAAVKANEEYVWEKLRAYYGNIDSNMEKLLKE